jgi:hypothetical protein
MKWFKLLSIIALIVIVRKADQFSISLTRKCFPLSQVHPVESRPLPKHFHIPCIQTRIIRTAKPRGSSSYENEFADLDEDDDDEEIVDDTGDDVDDDADDVDSDDDEIGDDEAEDVNQIDTDRLDDLISPLLKAKAEPAIPETNVRIFPILFTLSIGIAILILILSLLQMQMHYDEDDMDDTPAEEYQPRADRYSRYNKR